MAQHSITNKEHRSFFAIQFSKRKCLLLAYSIFVLLVIFEPDYIVTTSFHKLFRPAKYLAAFLTIFAFILRKVKLNGLLIGTIAFEGLLLLSTVINGSAVEVWINNCAYIIVLILFAQSVMEMDALMFPLALSVVLGLYTHINTVCRVLYPLGMYTSSVGYRNCWLLGYDNCAGLIIQLTITVTLFRIIYYKNRFLVWDWSVLLSGCWFILVQGIATTIIAGTLFFAFVIVSRNERIRKYFSRGTLVVVGMFLLFCMIHFVSIQENSIFSLAFKILGRNTTFTGRTSVWSAAWREIQNDRWLLGRGLQASTMYQDHFGGGGWAHLHSYYLQVIYEGGFLAFAALFGLLIYVAARFDKGKYSYTYGTFLAGLLAIMLMWQVEAYGDLIKYGFVILSLMYNTPLLVQSEGAHEEKRIRLKLVR